MDNIQLGFDTQTVLSGLYSTFADRKVRNVHVLEMGIEP